MSWFGADMKFDNGQFQSDYWCNFIGEIIKMKMTLLETTMDETNSRKSSIASIVLNLPNPFQVTGDSYGKRDDGTESRTWVKDFLKELKSRPTFSEKNGFESSDLNNDNNTSNLNDMIHDLENYIHQQKSESNEKESIRDMIEKKRQIFLLKMSIHMKQQEIQKLDAKLKAKTEAIKKSEDLLEEDSLRFDAFLKQNDRKAQEAIRMAETETKKKMDTLQDVKQMHQEVQSLQHSINKHTRNLEEYMKYAKFLDDLTPKDWFEVQRAIQSNRRKERRRRRIEARQELWKKEQAESRESEIKIETSSKKKRATTSELPKIHEPAMPDFEDEPLTSGSDEESPMYFSSPRQLLDKFAALEDEILFLIQNNQEAEQSLDEMTSRLNQSMMQAQKKADAMKSYISEIKDDISEREKSIDDIDKLRDDGDQNNMEPQLRQQAFMNEFTEKVKDLYIACGHTLVGSSTPSLLFMLSQIETSIETTMEYIHKIPSEKLKVAMKTKEKMRRERDRLLKQEEQRKLQDERSKKVLERSMQPPKKPNGKKIMYRSYLMQHDNITSRSKDMELTHEDLLEKKFLTAE